MYRVVWRVFAMIICGNLHQGVNESYHRAINLGLTSRTGEMSIMSSLRKLLLTQLLKHASMFLIESTDFA